MNNMPRILYVLHDNIKNAGGTEHHTKTLLSGLDDCYDTWVVYPGGDKLYVSNEGVRRKLYRRMTGLSRQFVMVNNKIRKLEVAALDQVCEADATYIW